jgi:uncharacterized protein DUF4279
VLKTRGRLVRSSVSLDVHGGALDFELIARGLHATPTDTQRKGDSAPSGAKLQNDRWSITSPLEPSSEVEKHLQWLAKALQPRIAFLRSLVRAPGIDRINIFCAITIDGEFYQLKLSPKSLDFLSGLEIGIDLSLVFLELSDSGMPSIDWEQHQTPVLSLPVDHTFRTESRVTITLPSNQAKLEAKLLSLGFQRLPEEPSPIPRSVTLPQGLESGGNVFRVPMSEADNLDLQLRWLARTFHVRRDLISVLANTVDISCWFGSECEWASIWLSHEALRGPADLQASLGLDLQLL